jgi:signal transduction histidine kinase
MSVMQFDHETKVSSMATGGSFVNRIDRLVDALVEPVPFDVLVGVAMEAMTGLGAVGAILVRLGPGGVVESVNTVGASTDMVSALGPLAVSEQVPILVAVRTGEPQWVPSRAALETRFPDFAVNVMRGQALASMPLLLGDDVVIGGLGVTFAEPRSFSDTERAFLLTVARIVTAAILRSADFMAPATAIRYPGAALFDSLSDAVMVYDESTDRLVYANAGTERVFGRGNGWLLRASGADLLGRLVGTPAEVRRSEKWLPGQRVYEAEIATFDGEARRYEVTISAANAVRQRAIVAADITDRVAAAPTIRSVDDAERRERERSEHELHDRAIQAVFATSMSLAALSQAVPDRLAERVDVLIDQLDELVAELNRR